MKALIIEDEKAAVRNLMALLGEVDPDIEVIDVLDSITDSVEWFQSHPMPELIFWISIWRMVRLSRSSVM